MARKQRLSCFLAPRPLAGEAGAKQGRSALSRRSLKTVPTVRNAEPRLLRGHRRPAAGQSKNQPVHSRQKPIRNLKFTTVSRSVKADERPLSDLYNLFDQKRLRSTGPAIQEPRPAQHSQKATRTSPQCHTRGGQTLPHPQWKMSADRAACRTSPQK